MKQYLRQRVIDTANYILQTHDTVRGASKLMKVSKSTVHADVHLRLKKIDRLKYVAVRNVLDENFKDKHRRGGNATKRKYLALKTTNTANSIDKNARCF